MIILKVIILLNKRIMGRTSYVDSPAARECTVCGVGHSQSLMNFIDRVKPANSHISFRLPTPEYRCPNHLLYIRCSLCRKYFDTGSLNNDNCRISKYPAILCPTPQQFNRCQNCGKWEKLREAELTLITNNICSCGNSPGWEVTP